MEEKEGYYAFAVNKGSVSIDFVDENCGFNRKLILLIGAPLLGNSEKQALGLLIANKLNDKILLPKVFACKRYVHSTKYGLVHRVTNGEFDRILNPINAPVL